MGVRGAMKDCGSRIGETGEDRRELWIIKHNGQPQVVFLFTAALCLGR